MEHFLSALSMQEVPGEKSEQLWFTLRRAFLAMVRPLAFDRFLGCRRVNGVLMRPGARIGLIWLTWRRRTRAWKSFDLSSITR